jgi:Cu/Ag efflux protein CusF
MHRAYLLGLALLAFPWMLRADAVSPTAKPTLTEKERENARSFKPDLTKHKPAAGSAAELHSAFGSISSIDASNKKISIDHAAFADGFQGAGLTTYSLMDHLALKIGKFKAGERVEFILQRGSSGSVAVWALRRLAN